MSNLTELVENIHLPGVPHTITSLGSELLKLKPRDVVEIVRRRKLTVDEETREGQKIIQELARKNGLRAHVYYGSILTSDGVAFETPKEGTKEAKTFEQLVLLLRKKTLDMWAKNKGKKNR